MMNTEIMGYHKIYNFPNGYGASVVSNAMSYGGKSGLFEIAVLDENGRITYDTPVTKDVLGYLTFADVAEILREIENLPEVDA